MDGFTHTIHEFQLITKNAAEKRNNSIFKQYSLKKGTLAMHAMMHWFLNIDIEAKSQYMNFNSFICIYYCDYKQCSWKRNNSIFEQFSFKKGTSDACHEALVPKYRHTGKVYCLRKRLTLKDNAAATMQCPVVWVGTSRLEGVKNELTMLVASVVETSLADLWGYFFNSIAHRSLSLFIYSIKLQWDSVVKWEEKIHRYSVIYSTIHIHYYLTLLPVMLMMMMINKYNLY